MARMSVFSSPLLLGFEHIEQMIDRANKSSAEGYPPYNIEQIDQNALQITLAVAGFSENDLAVTVEDNQLCIRGKTPSSSGERVYLHRGIASRNFTRSFVLAEGIEVKNARQENGLLHIELQRKILESKIKKIKINSDENLSSQKTINLD
ncbi:MAG: Hsp20 family protein [Pseudomonadota bacterium]|nr:Hsp20 family protein [Pseudomonadota bacterium]|tara:strand:+ start:331 stop:780 length:450 start_codon:yes stop_codon:yes gene_type:complete